MLGENVITHNSPKSPISEAYRVLRTNLQFTSLDIQLKTILVTSSQQSEGKSTTVANLAVTFAQNGMKVIIVDADLRKPKIHKMFWMSNRIGTTNAIVDQAYLEDYISKTDVEGLDILTSGPIPPNPSELLGSNKMKNLLSMLRELYDIVLIDSPPVGIVTDAQVLSTLTDGTIIIAAAGQVSLDSLKRAKQLLQAVNAKILGVILNKLDKETSGYEYYKSYQDSSETKKGRKNKRSRKK